MLPLPVFINDGIRCVGEKGIASQTGHRPPLKVILEFSFATRFYQGANQAAREPYVYSAINSVVDLVVHLSLCLSLRAR